MKRLILAGTLSALFIAAANAQTPVGEWVVKDGTAHIRILPCGDALWGVISWTKDAPGRDENNPDPSKRNRSVMGMPILINMKQDGARWEGKVYNAENGETYNANISLAANDVLTIEGCVFGGIFCGGEDWKRLVETGNTPNGKPLPSKPAGGKAAANKTAANKTTPPADDVCTALAKES